MIAPVVTGNPVNGPLTYLYGQDKWADHKHPERQPAALSFRRPRLMKLLGVKPWGCMMRLAPPGRVPPSRLTLTVFGDRLAARLGEDLPRSAEQGDEAVWIFGGVGGRNAVQALDSVIDWLGQSAPDVSCGSIAIRVWRVER